MVTYQDIVYFFLFENFIALIAFLIYFVLSRRWKIPVTVLRYSGDKRRPTIFHTKARLVNIGSISKLYIKGFKNSVRNFKNENYYPSPKSSYGGLILWEYKKGWLTPLIPEKKVMDPAVRDELNKFIDDLHNNSAIDFEFNEELYNKLLLTAIDDTDAEWNLRQQQRIDAQYEGGMRDFLNKYGASIVLIIIAICLLTGFIVWLKESPNWAGQCINAGVEAAKNTYLKDLASKVTPGTPTDFSNNDISPGGPIG